MNKCMKLPKSGFQSTIYNENCLYFKYLPAGSNRVGKVSSPTHKQKRLQLPGDGSTCFSPGTKDILVFHGGNNMYGNDCNIVSRYYLCHVGSNKYIHLHNYTRRIFPLESLPDQLSFPSFLCSSNAFHSSFVIPSIYFFRIFDRSSYSCISSSYFLFK